MTRGFFAIGIYHTKTKVNVGTLIRSARSFGADFVFTIGKRYDKQSSSKKSERHIPVLHFLTVSDWKDAMPSVARLIAIELDDNAVCLTQFKHPQQAIYLLGAEDHGLPKEMLNGCQIVQIPGTYCHNVAVAGSIVMYDRIAKGIKP